MKKPNIPTWIYETAVVYAVVIAALRVVGPSQREVVAAFVVVATHGINSISARIAEANAHKPPPVHCLPMLWIYLLLKETAVAASLYVNDGPFLSLVGAVVFAVYLVHRKIHRIRFPLPIPQEAKPLKFDVSFQGDPEAFQKWLAERAGEAQDNREPVRGVSPDGHSVVFTPPGPRHAKPKSP